MNDFKIIEGFYTQTIFNSLDSNMLFKLFDGGMGAVSKIEIVNQLKLCDNDDEGVPSDVCIEAISKDGKNIFIKHLSIDFIEVTVPGGVKAKTIFGYGRITKYKSTILTAQNGDSIFFGYNIDDFDKTKGKVIRMITENKQIYGYNAYDDVNNNVRLW